MLEWIITVVAIGGAVLNVLHRPEGFAVWMVTNAALCVVSIRRRRWAQVPLWLVYFAVAVWGVVAWSK